MTLQEVRNAARSLKNNKSPAADAFPGELLKHEGLDTLRRSHELILNIWDVGDVPQEWRNSRIISLYKNNGVCTTCGNSRVILLPSLLGYVFAQVILSRGFRRIPDTTDMLFAACQIHEIV